MNFIPLFPKLQFEYLIVQTFRSMEVLICRKNFFSFLGFDVFLRPIPIGNCSFIFKIAYENQEQSFSSFSNHFKYSSCSKTAQKVPKNVKKHKNSQFLHCLGHSENIFQQRNANFIEQRAADLILFIWSFCNAFGHTNLFQSQRKIQ